MAATRVSIIGSGNVAWSLSKALDDLDGVSVTQVYAPHIERARQLTSRLSDAEAIDSLDMLVPDADIYLFAIRDEALGDVIESIPVHRSDAIYAHTSGTFPIFKNLEAHAGVFYPMQTFSRGHDVDMSTVPFFIEGDGEITRATLTSLASRLSPMVRGIDGKTRTLLHAAAVCACNFSNYLWTISSDLLNRRGIGFDVMQSLVNETMRKAFESGPANGQTGPAMRGDISTIRRHAALIGGSEAELYIDLSKRIMNYHHIDYEQDKL